jgi:hypothetical protein
MSSFEFATPLQLKRRTLHQTDAHSCSVDPHLDQELDSQYATIDCDLSGSSKTGDEVRWNMIPPPVKAEPSNPNYRDQLVCPISTAYPSLITTNEPSSATHILPNILTPER